MWEFVENLFVSSFFWGLLANILLMIMLIKYLRFRGLIAWGVISVTAGLSGVIYAPQNSNAWEELMVDFLSWPRIVSAGLMFLMWGQLSIE